jgi:TrbC/VIRB2 pilin
MTSPWVCRMLFAFGILSLLAYADPAMAQIAGGTTGAAPGWLATLIQSVQTNLLSGLIEAGVLIGGVMMIFQRHTMAGLATMICGSLIVTNATTIAGLI